MEVFIALKAPRGDAQRIAASQVLADAVRAAGHVPFVAWQAIEEQDLRPQQFMPLVRERLADCQLLIVLYHPELRGGLIELGIAFAYQIPIWLVVHHAETVSSSVLGCANQVLEYDTLSDLQVSICERLQHVSNESLSESERSGL